MVPLPPLLHPAAAYFLQLERERFFAALDTYDTAVVIPERDRKVEEYCQLSSAQAYGACARTAPTFFTSRADISQRVRMLPLIPLEPSPPLR